MLKSVASFVCCGIVVAFAQDAAISFLPTHLDGRPFASFLSVVCSASGGVVTSVEWFRDGEPIGSTGRVRVDDSTRQLSFAPTDWSDAGFYECRATVDGVTISKKIELSLIKVVEFTDAPAEQHPEVGSDARIRCFADGTPPPTMRWFRGATNDAISGDEERLSLDEDSQVLVIASFEPQTDDGVYTCRAEQTANGQFVERQIQVTGHFKPSIESLSVDNQLAHEGGSVELTCVAEAKPAPDFEWYRGSAEGGDRLADGKKYALGRPGRLLVNSLVPEDAGEYTCVASNHVGKASESVQFGVLRWPRIEKIGNQTVAAGQDVTIECHYESDESTDVVWYNSAGVEIGSSDSARDDGAFTTGAAGVLVLHVIGVTEADANEYTCAAANVVGKSERRVWVQITSAPKIVAHSALLRSWPGERRELHCDASGVPEPQWRWLAPNSDQVETDGVLVVVEQSPLRSKLTVSTQVEADFGTYTCVASNGVGEAASETIEIFRVDAPVAPQSLVFNGSHPNTALVRPFNGSQPTWSPNERPTSLTFIVSSEGLPTLERVVAYDAETDWLTIDGLEADTTYSMRSRSANERGESALSPSVVYTTSSAQPPAQPVFVETFDEPHRYCADACRIGWVEPNDGGSTINAYRLTFEPVELVDGAPRPTGEQRALEPLDASRRQVQLYDLQPKTHYLLRLTAENDVGSSEEASVIVLTSETGGVRGGMSAGGVVAVVAVVLLVVLAIVDVACYFLHQCGLLMCVCVNCCGKAPPDSKHKDIQMEEGVSSNENKALLKEKEVDEKVPTVQTITADENGASGKATTV